MWDVGRETVGQPTAREHTGYTQPNACFRPHKPTSIYLYTISRIPDINLLTQRRWSFFSRVTTKISAARCQRYGCGTISKGTRTQRVYSCTSIYTRSRRTGEYFPSNTHSGNNNAIRTEHETPPAEPPVTRSSRIYYYLLKYMIRYYYKNKNTLQL